MVRRYSDPWDNDPPFDDDPPFSGGPTLTQDRDRPPFQGGGKSPRWTTPRNPLTDIFGVLDGLLGNEERIRNAPRGNNFPNPMGRELTPMRGSNDALRGRGGPPTPRNMGRGNMPDSIGYDGMSFADALAQAMALVGGGGGGTAVADNRIEAAKSANADANARIAALYSALNQDLSAQVPQMREQAEAALDSSREQTDLSQAGMEAARNASREAEHANLQETGIGDSELLRAGRDRADSDLQFSVGQLQNRAADQAGLIEGRHDANLGLHQGIQRGAGLRGAEMQVQNERSLLNMLAELRDEQYAAQQEAAQRGQQSRMQAIGLAQDISNQDYNRWRDQQSLDMEMDDRAYSRAMDAQQMQNSGGMDMEQARLLLNNLPEGHPMRDMIMSEVMGISPMMYQLMGQPQKQMVGLPKGLK